MGFEYKSYILDKTNHCVYGVITENEKAIGYHHMQNYQGKLIPIKGVIYWGSKRWFKERDFDYTTSKEVAFNHMMSRKNN